MSDKPSVGSWALGVQYPNKFAVYNCNFEKGERCCYMAEPWAVDLGNNRLDMFSTFEQAMDFVREHLSQQAVS